MNKTKTITFIILAASNFMLNSMERSNQTMPNNNQGTILVGWQAYQHYYALPSNHLAYKPASSFQATYEQIEQQIKDLEFGKNKLALEKIENALLQVRAQNKYLTMKLEHFIPSTQKEKELLLGNLLDIDPCLQPLTKLHHEPLINKQGKRPLEKKAPFKSQKKTHLMVSSSPEDDSIKAVSHNKATSYSSHTMPLPTPCQYRGCTQVFNYQHDLIEHVKEHSPHKRYPFLCIFCGLSCRHQSTLGAHYKCHTNN